MIDEGTTPVSSGPGGEAATQGSKDRIMWARCVMSRCVSLGKARLDLIRRGVLEASSLRRMSSRDGSDAPDCECWNRRARNVCGLRRLRWCSRDAVGLVVGFTAGSGCSTGSR
jgi:hypothetical protein